ncbi:hypothetical protein AB834_02505 [PVC group bacterium (ex Bugula neritina AB1)]|nr:hypothetical protein AB834_02505 [PVC group bacterium (ex Bugula neritina AB1)]
MNNILRFLQNMSKVFLEFFIKPIGTFKESLFNTLIPFSYFVGRRLVKKFSRFLEVQRFL